MVRKKKKAKHSVEKGKNLFNIPRLDIVKERKSNQHTVGQTRHGPRCHHIIDHKLTLDQLISIMTTSTPYPVSLSELHFSSTEQSLSLSLSQTLSALRRSALSVANRLRSIETDARFVREVAHHYRLPLIANERCGGWYIPPERKAASVYFKSTDGHAGQWNWSDRRLNLHILPIARDHGG